jgi:hypothetical protein
MGPCCYLTLGSKPPTTETEEVEPMIECDNCGSDDLVFGNVQWDPDEEEWFQDAECAVCGGHTEVEY